MNKAFRLILVAVLLTTSFLYSQKRKMRYELIGGVGFTSFLGDLGGANQVGTHFIKDLDLFATRPLLSGGIRYKHHPIFAFKGTMTIGMLAGNDKLTQDPYRENRNLSFRAPIIELSAQAEFYFIRERAPKLYSFKFVGNRKKKNLAAYGFVGVGGLFFVPQGNYNGHWYNLRKLSTEGEGLPGGAKPYSNFTMCIPYGVGLKWGLTRQVSVGAELGFRFAFSDYIDDVSGTYYDPKLLLAAKGPTAVALADPSLGNIPGATSPDSYGHSAQRGNPKNKDAYAFFSVNMQYKVFKTRKRRTRSKF